MSDRDTTAGLQKLLGSFWTEIYHARDQVRTLCAGLAELGKQHRVDLEYAASLISRTTLQPYRRERWYPWLIRKSQKNTASAALAKYDGEFVYDGTLVYGQALPGKCVYPAPAGLRRFLHAANRISEPSSTWTHGVTVRIESGALLFLADPFDDPNVPIVVTDDDEVAMLWLSDAEFDHGDVYAQHGIVFGLDADQDSQTAIAAVRVAADGIVLGNNQAQFKAVLATATGVPVVAADEAVVLIDRQATKTAIVTATHVYEMPPQVLCDVSPGDQLYAGEFCSPDVAIWSFNDGPTPAWFRALVATDGMVSQKYANRILVENRSFPLVTGSVKPRARFPLGESQATYELLLHADNLQNLPDAIEEWNGGSLPSEINPLQFFLDNWWRTSLVAVYVDGRVPAGDNWYLLNFLRNRIPPNLLLVLLIGLGLGEATMTLGDVSATLGEALEPKTESILLPTVTATLRVGQTCE